MTIFLVDDGSTDGTYEAVRHLFPDVILLRGDGSLYMYGSMRLAVEHARKRGLDAAILMNDDVVLDTDSFYRALYWLSNLGTKTMLGGAMRDPKTKSVTYAGFRRSKLFPLKMQRITPARDAPVEVDALNGNFILVSNEILANLRNFAPYVIQKLGDIEISLRARKEGFECVLMPGVFGSCSFNSTEKRVYGFRALKKLFRKNELPPSVLAPFCKTHGGPLWVLWLFTSYLSPFFKGY